MQLFRITELFPTANWHFFWVRRIRVRETSLEGIKLLISWNLDFDSNTSWNVCTKLRSISYGKTIWRTDCNFVLFSIYFFHSFNFPELDSISIAKSMLFFFMEINNTCLLLSNSCNMDRFLLLSSWVNHFVIISKVNKCESIETKITSIDESNVFVSACFVKIDEILTIIMI